jgi:pimeloyl-ACP methyl ester carboxylesterase
VKKLVLLSPFASEICPDTYMEQFENNFRSSSWIKRKLWKFVRYLYKKRVTPFGMARKGGRLVGGWGIKRRITKGLGQNLPELTDYMHQIIMAEEGSESAFNIMFPDFFMTDRPIMKFVEQYKEHGIEVSFYYGDRDWMDTNFNGKYVSEQLNEIGAKVYMVDNCGHHLYFDNPTDTLEYILDDFSIE